MKEKMIVEREIRREIRWWDWIVLLCFFAFVLWFICGCASQARGTSQMDSVHPVAVAETQPQQAQVQPKQQSKSYQGPTVFGSGWYSDIKYRSVYNTSVVNNWKVSPDGSSGSMSSTRINTYEKSTDGVQGNVVGPAGFWHGY